MRHHCVTENCSNKAETMVDCGACHGSGGGYGGSSEPSCPSCHGTGLVANENQLCEECLGWECDIWTCHDTIPHKHCGECGERGHTSDECTMGADDE